MSGCSRGRWSVEHGVSERAGAVSLSEEHFSI